MIISFKYKYIFLKNRKVAGSTIQYILRKYLFDSQVDISSSFKLHDHEITDSSSYNLDLLTSKKIPQDFNQHSGIRQVISLLRASSEEIKKNFFIFCIERNSYDKTVSSYEFSRKKTGIDGINLKFPDIKNFRDFFNYKLIIPSDWNNYTINNNVFVDRVFQHSELNNMIGFINNRFDVKIPKNELSNIKLKSGFRDFKDYKKYYTKETKDIVRKIFKREIENFNYKF